jgi:hypothetical protein
VIAPQRAACEEANPVSPAQRCTSVMFDDTRATDRVTSRSFGGIERRLFGAIIRPAAFG